MYSLWRQSVIISGRRAHGLPLTRSIFGVSKHNRKESQSKVLGDVSSQIYELQINDVKPECMQEYLNETENVINKVNRLNIPFELSGSWTTDVGSKLDQAIHMFKYKGGYKAVDQCTQILQSNDDWNNYKQKVTQLVTNRERQILCAFTFWDPTALEVKTKRGFYELRSYTLKPGTLIEWGHMWRRGIQYRKKEEAVGGWFSQIGKLHMVHHLWAYCDYMDRHETRQAAWEMPGWDQCVLETVPLVRHMETRILKPSSFSPLQ